MPYSETQLEGFFEAVESLKKYRRADLIDNKGRDLLKELYTDLLPNDYILKKTLKENTTFLVGRKGTGKSTIFLRLEQELKTKKEYLPCYLDVKTIYESSQTVLSSTQELETLLDSKLLEKYLVERAFIQTVLTTILNEISNKFNSNTEKLLKAIGLSKVEEVKEKISELKHNIENNNYLKKIELPILQTINSKKTTINEENDEVASSIKGAELSAETTEEGIKASFKTNSGIEQKNNNKTTTENEDIFSNVFLKVFQIKEVILGIKEALSVLKIRHLYILLDDFSEIDDTSINTANKSDFVFG